MPPRKSKAKGKSAAKSAHKKGSSQQKSIAFQWPKQPSIQSLAASAEEMQRNLTAEAAPALSGLYAQMAFALLNDDWQPDLARKVGNEGIRVLLSAGFSASLELLLVVAQSEYECGDDAAAEAGLERVLAEQQKASTDVRPSTNDKNRIDITTEIASLRSSLVRQKEIAKQRSATDCAVEWGSVTAESLDVRQSIVRTGGKGIFVRCTGGIPRHATMFVEAPEICLQKPSSQAETVCCHRCLAVLGVLSGVTAGRCARGRETGVCVHKTLREIARGIAQNEEVKASEFMKHVASRSLPVDSIVACAGGLVRCGALYCSKTCLDLDAKNHSLICLDSNWLEFDSHNCSTSHRFTLAGKILVAAISNLHTFLADSERSSQEANDLVSTAMAPFSGFCRVPWMEVQQVDEITHETEIESAANAGLDFASVKQGAMMRALTLLLSTKAVGGLRSDGSEPERTRIACEIAARQWLSAAAWSRLLGAIDLNAAEVETHLVSHAGRTRVAPSSQNDNTAAGTALFSLHSSFNHSCRPNAQAVSGARNAVRGARIRVVALSAIAAHEEVTISYIDESLPKKSRQKHLKESYCFDCRCKKCLEEAD